jgi:hypothetical protein
MPGLVPGIHVLLASNKKTWMAGTSPAMTNYHSRRSETCSTAWLAAFLRIRSAR